MERARADFIAEHHGEHLTAQVQAWRLARDIRVLVTEVRASDADLNEEWVAWAEDYAARFDPVGKPFVVPPDPEPSPEALKPYLGRWSPYGPDRTSW